MGKLGIIARAGTMLSAMAVLAVGITFAAVQDTATLTDNTIASATADLRVSSATDCSDATVDADFTAEAEGFNFTGVIPGGDASDDQHFCLRNVGTESAPLAVKLTVPALPTYTDSEAAPVTVDNTKVHLNLTCTTTGSDPFGVDGTLHATWFNGTDQGTLAAGDTAVCEANVAMDENAFAGSSVTSTGFDLVFTGTAEN